MTSNKIRIGMVDDHQIVLDGLYSLLQDDHRMAIQFSTTQPQMVLRLMEEQPIDLLLTDVMMPLMSGHQLAKQVRLQFPHTKILALSMSGEGSIVNDMINDSDIAGYVIKNVGKQELIVAIEKIAAGGIYFSDEVLKELEKTAQRSKEVAQAHLTDREIDIIRLIVKERSNKQIADDLFISDRTVETHRKNIFRKLGINNVVGLIKFAYEHGIVKS